MTDVIALDPQTERQLATDLFNHVWRLLELEERTPEQDDDLLHSAHASRWHWGRVGSAQHWAIGEWQCSRVNAVLGRDLGPGLGAGIAGADLCSIQTFGPQAADQAGSHVSGADKGNTRFAHNRSF